MQTVGEWELKLGSNDGDSSLRCGHDMPDRVMTMPNSNNGFDNPGFEVQSTIKVALTEPDKATDEAGNRGFWTLIYDEGMEIRVGGKEVRRARSLRVPCASQVETRLARSLALSRASRTPCPLAAPLGRAVLCILQVRPPRVQPPAGQGGGLQQHLLRDLRGLVSQP